MWNDCVGRISRPDTLKERLREKLPEGASFTSQLNVERYLIRDTIYSTRRDEQLPIQSVNEWNGMESAQ